METNQVILGDCLTILRDIPSNTADLCFADPPFNLNKGYASHNDNMGESEYLEWCERWILELVRVTKPTGAIMVHNIPKWLTYCASILNRHAHFKHWISWDAPTTPMGKSLQPAHYGILFYTKSATGAQIYPIRAPHKKCRLCNGYLKDYGGKPHLRHKFGYLISDVWTDIHRIRHNKRRDLHPCQLPIPLLERVILLTTKPGDLVIDPFLGTGTTAVAAKKLGRDYLGIELSPDYVDIAEHNLTIITKTLPYSVYLGKVQTIRDCDLELLEREYGD